MSKVAGSCLYQLRRLRQIRRLVGQEVTAQLVSAFILSRLDYCTSVLAGLPRCTTEPLQRVLNAAARLVLNLRLHDHVTPALQQLHWLPIEYRITYKLCLTMYLVHTNRTPQYLSDCVQTVSRSNGRPDLLTPLHTSSRGSGPGSENAASLMPDPLLGTVFQTTFIKSVTPVYLNAVLKLNYSVEHIVAIVLSALLDDS